MAGQTSRECQEAKDGLERLEVQRPGLLRDRKQSGGAQYQLLMRSLSG